MNQKFANLSRALLAQSVDTADTQFSVKNAVAVPSLDTGEFFIATVFTISSDYGTNIEIVKVVQVDGNLWTVERGQEDTTAKEHPQNSHIELRLTAGALSDIHDELAKPKEWSAETVTKAEAEATSGDTRKAWTVTRVNEASQAWWERSPMMDKLDSIETGAKDDQLANEVPVVSTGNLKSTNVQSALEELQLDVDTINDDLETKVDKVVGQGLSDSNYTQAEKDKLAGLESSHFKGQFVSLEALQEAFPLSIAGDYANVDEGAGFDVIRYVWDTSDSVWLPQLGASAQLTAAQIKQEYESNPDTNVFSDFEKTKLDGIALGATKNRADSANADKVHTHTTAQVTGLDTVLLNKVDKVAGKGLSSTDFTQAEKTKLAGVVTGATANRADTLNADKTHTHTTAQITGLDTDLGVKADKTTQVIAGTGLSGGGTLAANRTLNVSYGTTAGTVTQGNDSRLSNNREWTASVVSQTEAQAGTATTARKWTAQRVRQAVMGWWSGSADKTKLDSVEEGATNIPRITGSLTVTVGSGGDFPKISDAIDDLIRRKKVNRYLHTTIRLLPGFVIDEQIIVRNTDLSWITLTSNTELITSTFSPSAVLGSSFGYGSGLRGVFAVANGKLPLFYNFNYQPNISGWSAFSYVFAVVAGGEISISDSSITCTGTSSSGGGIPLGLSLAAAQLRSAALRPAKGANAVRLINGSELAAYACNFRAAGSNVDASTDILVQTSSTESGNLARLSNCQGGTSIAPNTFVNGSLVLSN